MLIRQSGTCSSRVRRRLPTSCSCIRKATGIERLNSFPSVQTPGQDSSARETGYNHKGRLSSSTLKCAHQIPSPIHSRLGEELVLFGGRSEPSTRDEAFVQQGDNDLDNDDLSDIPSIIWTFYPYRHGDHAKLGAETDIFGKHVGRRS